ncbi:hypothetical protein K431DRAFT_36406 [Polychaeton citri CBS 116435]|uniref:Uncharacterized protein n=1 Tax=Polychaeton citri CBS 116435 TaxID=1314669 RepID=A0A9P4USC1_9PEZI|nr:hypothetical protein K431DRAFT_36406 [Polychaeton citri CBS 116435]
MARCECSTWRPKARALPVCLRKSAGDPCLPHLIIGEQRELVDGRIAEAGEYRSYEPGAASSFSTPRSKSRGLVGGCMKHVCGCTARWLGSGTPGRWSFDSSHPHLVGGTSKKRGRRAGASGWTHGRGRRMQAESRPEACICPHLSLFPPNYRRCGN